MAFGQFGKFKKTKGSKPLATLPDDNQFRMPSIAGTSKKKHTHATIKGLEKQMKKQVFWNAKPDRQTAIGIIDQLLSVRKKTKKRKGKKR